METQRWRETKVKKRQKKIEKIKRDGQIQRGVERD